jgi:Domain of unknown function (DUF1854)
MPGIEQMPNDNESANFAALKFRRDEWGQLVMTLADGTTHSGVEPVRCFPLTDPSHLIAILDSDGHEVLNLPSADILAPAARDILQQALAEREFVPVIHRIISASPPNPPCTWEVETDRGHTSFSLESDDDVRRLGQHGTVIADSNGIRYQIPNWNQLDPHSQRILRRLV